MAGSPRSRPRTSSGCPADPTNPSDAAGGPQRLVDWPWVVVEVECSLCRRHGRYRLARLAERHGAGTEMGALLAAISARCGLAKPEAKPRQYEARCGARYRVPAGGPLPAGALAREAKPGEIWPPRPRRRGPEGPLPTVDDMRRQGVAQVGVRCLAIARHGAYCQHTATLDVAALPAAGDLPFVHLAKVLRLRCARCGGRRASVYPLWPSPSRERLMPDGRPIMPGTVRDYQMPGAGEAPTAQ